MFGLSLQSKMALVVICSVFTSCATLLNKEGTSSTIYTHSPSRIVVNQDTVQTVGNSVNVPLKRSQYPFEITVLTDTSIRKVMVQSQGSLAYRMNIYNYGLGLIVDYMNPKRYSYPSKIYLDQDEIKGYSIFGEANNKGEVFLHFSFPYINSFLIKPVNEHRKASTGFMGLSLGLDYYHSKKQFLNLSFSGVMDFIAPVPAPVRYEGTHEHFSSVFLSFSNNHKIRTFSPGYGITLARNIWGLRNSGSYETESSQSTSIDPIIKRSNALGLLFSSYFQTGQYFNIGFIYRPTFIRLNTTRNLRYQYDHLISLDLAWKIILKR